MRKGRIITAAIAAFAAGAITEVVIHSYYDLMYKETIPQGVLKKATTKSHKDKMGDLYAFTAENNAWVQEQQPETIDRENERGFVLKGYLLPAAAESKKYVLFAHGYRSSHNSHPANFAKFYHDLGYNFMSVDHTAAGDSEGDFVGFDYFESKDMLDWIDYLIERFGEDIEIILHGISMGAATVCQMSDKVPPQVRAIVSDCAYTSALEQFSNMAQDAGVKYPEPFLRLFNAMNKRLAGFDLKDTDVRESIRNTKVPMLFVHGEDDDVVPVRMGYELYDLCGTGDKDILIVEGAKHCESIFVNNEGYKAKLLDFLGKYFK
jgi:hypothetical protein